MTYFADGTAYRYLERSKAFDSVPPGMKNAGWLHPDESFATGLVDGDLTEHLFSLAATTSNGSTRGIHPCPFCEFPEPAVNEINGMRMRPKGTFDYTSPGGQTVFLGSAEVWVFSANGDGGWIAPNLIGHYVASHNYRPPDEFLAALRHVLGTTH